MDFKKLRFWNKKPKSHEDLKKEQQKLLDNLQKLTEVVDELKRKRDSEEITQEEFRQLVNEATGIKISRR